MKRAFLPLLTLVLGIGIGVMTGGMRRAKDAGNGATGAAAHVTTRNTASPGSVALMREFLDGRSPADLTAEEAIQLLLPWLTRDPSDKSYNNTLEGLRSNNQFRLLMDTLPLPVLEEVMAIARSRRLPIENTRDLFAAWAARDWDGAMASAGSGGEALYLRSAAIALLAEKNPEGAEHLYQEILLKNPVDYHADIVCILSKHHAKKGLASFLGFLDTIPEISEAAPYRLGLDNLPDAEIPAYLNELVKRRREGEWIPINGLVHDLMNRDMKLFRQWMGKLPAESRGSGMLTAALNMNYRGRVEESRALLRECLADTAGREKQFVVANAPALADSPALVEEIVKLLPEDQRPAPEDLVPDAESISREHLAKPWRLVKLFTTPEDQAAYLVAHFGAFSSMNYFNEKDFEILSQRLVQSALTGENEKRVRTALEQARMRVMDGDGGD